MLVDLRVPGGSKPIEKRHGPDRLFYKKENHVAGSGILDGHGFLPQSPHGLRRTRKVEMVNSREALGRETRTVIHLVDWKLIHRNRARQRQIRNSSEVR